MADTHIFTKEEEVANAVTHGIGAALSIVGLVFLIVAAVMEGTALHVVSFTIFGVSMMLLYISSTLVHALRPGKAKDLFEIFDHSSIYLFIAGSYTPLSLIVIQGKMGWTLFWVVWGLALFGIIFKVYFVKRFVFTSTLLYVGMGWLVVLGWNQIMENLHPTGVGLLVAGGIAYTAGAVFYVWRGFKYHHMIWHLFVIAGSVLHFFCMILYVLPIR